MSYNIHASVIIFLSPPTWGHLSLRGALKKEIVVKNAGKNPLIQNENAKSIFNILKDAKLEQMRCLVWKMVGTTKYTAEVEIDVIRKFDNELILRSVSDGHYEKVKTIVSGSEQVNVFIMEKAIMFRAKIKKLDLDQKLCIQFPKMIAQAERRKDLRLVFPSDLSCPVQFFKTLTGGKVQTQIFEKNCYDLSAGGLSVLINKSESKFFEIGDEISDMKIEIEKEVVSLDGKIVNFIPVEPGPDNKLIYKGLRVCLKFEEVSDEDKKLINMFVFKHLDLDDVAS